eukprot:comp24037_c0_seq1/m.43040 comp24037_c0_seq1/g.43040  ORF comp24037_c0_seq1/g.43040 comp24037_c0_seq1/m.43040 type:complete len:725 (-) comp24037_c0_seq1:627-2801(-)
MADQGWDLGETIIIGDNGRVNRGDGDHPGSKEAEEGFFQFLRNYRSPDETFTYRDMLRSHYNSGQYHITVDLDHVLGVNQVLGQCLMEKPGEYLPLFENACKRAADEITRPRPDDEPVKDMQVMLSSSQNTTLIRDLDSQHVTHLVRVPGIVIKAGTIRAKATHLVIQCKNCRNTKDLPIKSGFSGATLPRSCDREAVDGANETKCPLDPYEIVADRCRCVDQQVLKLQESPELVPTGELPRHVLLTAERFLAHQVVPGTRVTVVGIYDVFTPKGSKGSDNATRQPYLRVVGFMQDKDGSGRNHVSFTHDEEAAFMTLSKDPDLYNKIAASIAPEIFGSEDIKKSIACLLFGGSRKQLPDGMRLRGDINVLLLGDPGTAKSQLLKVVEKLAPVAVYTSGKGSSAAGLTASVMRDPSTREFFLEAGAMVLADGGVVCIDEFDKMREDDRVAIHEAMEQQTISIAKAGITTILNTRTSVLAAANSTFGRWDDSQSGESNLEFQATVLSRFDMIYIIKDTHDPEQDARIARHVINYHQNVTSSQLENTHRSPIDPDFLKKYINYARRTCGPRLNQEATERLVNEFINIRKLAKNSKSAIPITIRQLEAIVRISESLAKMSLSKFATWVNVEEALRLFRQSTLQAATNGDLAGVEGMTTQEDIEQVQEVEKRIQRRLPISQATSRRLVIEDLCNKGYSEFAVVKAIETMVRKGELEYRNQRKMIYRRR